jgi:hypothetical protein
MKEFIKQIVFFFLLIILISSAYVMFKAEDQTSDTESTAQDLKAQ